MIYALSSSISMPVKIDVDISMVTMARFALICVVVNLTKALVARFWLDDKWYVVEYEGIHTICFGRGR